MTNIKYIAVILGALGAISNADSTSTNNYIDFDEVIALNLPAFGPNGIINLGETRKVCYFHDNAISTMHYTSLCDVARLNSSQRANLLSSDNQEYARVLIEEGSFAHIEVAHVDPGDPNCYTRKIIRHYKPPNW